KTFEALAVIKYYQQRQANILVLCPKRLFENWNVFKIPAEENNDFRSIHAWDKNRALIFGINDPDFGYLTKDGGETWISSETMPTEYRSCVQVVTNEIQTFYFTIGKTGCDYSVDGGKNWVYISDNGFYTFRSVPGKLMGFAVGGNGKISRLKFDISNE
ncbi:MAG: hypothetical protein P1P88_19960, partial [Bacteroidales bacterium]|nr:hypothetical protein [Bacteroidales bacterium]